MNLDDMTEMAFTRLSWREKLAVLHIELWHALRRLLRLEHRYYLTLDGRVVARFTADTDHAVVLKWLTDSHIRATDYGVTIGRESAVAKYFAGQANAGDPGTS